MEHKLGETFTWHGQTLAVAEVKDQEEPCSGCWFLSTPSPATATSLTVRTIREETILT